MSRLRHAVYRWCIVTLIIAHISPKNVTFETRRMSLCIVTLIIAHVSPNVSLENVTFETRRVSLCIVTLIIAHISLNFMAGISLMSRHDFWYGLLYYSTLSNARRFYSPRRVLYHSNHDE
jgi:uncharacterized membrane protein